MKESFFIKDCTLSVIALGETAASLIQLKDVIARVPLSSIYYHFWGKRIHPSFIHPEFHNDFASWAYHSIRDSILSERLGIIDPTEYPDLEGLRKTLIDVIENRIDEVDWIFWSNREWKFHFLSCTTLVFETGIEIRSPPDLKVALPKMSPSSIFYHMIDARKRTPNKKDDFSGWLEGFNDTYTDLVEKIRNIDPFFMSSTEIKQKLLDVINERFP